LEALAVQKPERRGETETFSNHVRSPRAAVDRKLLPNTGATGDGGQADGNNLAGAQSLAAHEVLKNELAAGVMPCGR
jgi:hypothetical protein